MNTRKSPKVERTKAVLLDVIKREPNVPVPVRDIYNKAIVKAITDYPELKIPNRMAGTLRKLIADGEPISFLGKGKRYLMYSPHENTHERNAADLLGALIKIRDIADALLSGPSVREEFSTMGKLDELR